MGGAPWCAALSRGVGGQWSVVSAVLQTTDHRPLGSRIRPALTDLAWTPSDTYIANANVTRLMRAHGIDSIDELRRRSVEDVEWYWDAVAEDRGLEVASPYERVRDDSAGAPWAQWTTAGRGHRGGNCVGR